MRTTSNSSRCSRRIDEKKDGTVPIDVLLKRDERTVYSGEVYYSTDFGAGVRVGAQRRWLNKKGHKADVKVEYSQRLQEAGVHYRIPRPSREDRSYDFGVGLSRRDHRRQPFAQFPARRHAFGEALAWFHAHDRTQVSGRRFRDRRGRRQPRVRQLRTVVRGSHAEPPPRRTTGSRHARATCSSSACALASEARRLGHRHRARLGRGSPG